MDTQEIKYSLAKRVPAMANGCYVDTVYGEIGIDRDAAPAVMAAVRQVLERRLMGGDAPAQATASGISAASLLEISRRQIEGALDHGRGAAALYRSGAIDWLSAFNRIGAAEDAMTVGCAVMGQALAHASPPADRELDELERLQIAADAEFSDLKARLQGHEDRAEMEGVR